MSDVALGLMGADLKRRESISGRFADILAQMYMLTATIKRFQEDGEKVEDILLLKVAMNNGFSKIDESFLGIYENLTGGFLGSIFKIRGFFSKLNPLGSVIKDSDLHKIAQDVGEDESLRNRLCFNIYKGGRVSELGRATIAMQKAKEPFVKVKKEGFSSLNEVEKELIQKAKLWQANIVEVDSFTKEEYFHKQTILEKV
jgi:acyl-CoA dehydrogenase